MSEAILGVDLGSVRIGVAIAESAELPPLPLSTLTHVSKGQDARAIAALADERGAQTIVVGYPLRLDGSPGPAAERIDRFIETLEAVFPGAILRVDERMTTAAAAKRLLGGGLSGSKRRKVVDQVAAVEILDTYLKRLRLERIVGSEPDGSGISG